MRSASSRSILEVLILLVLAALGTSALGKKDQPPPPEPAAPAFSGEYTVCGIAPGMTESEVRQRQGPVRSVQDTEHQLVRWQLDEGQVYFSAGRVVAIYGHQAYRASTRLGSLLSTDRRETARRIGREPDETLRFSPQPGGGSGPGLSLVRDTYQVAEDWYLVVTSGAEAGQPEFVLNFWLGPGDLRDTFFSKDPRFPSAQLP
ncbi:MAG: hypothetical protein HY319_12660 [Armatimonadetes bacterium]|nr:hypothetical protein [Armatimonadota bacterium]